MTDMQNGGIAVSVVVPVFNGEDFIRKCVHSILNQDLSEIEIILIDDGSTDSTPSILDNLMKAYPQIHAYHIPNGGQGLARNFGIDKCKGEYVGFVDADDFIDSCMYGRLYLEAKKSNSDIAWSFTKSTDWTEHSPFGAKTIFESDEEIGSFAAELVGGNPSSRDDSLLGMHVGKCIYRRSYLNDNGIRFESERVVNSEDLLFNLDALTCCSRLLVVDEAFYTICYDANPDSYSKRYDEDRINAFTELHRRMIRRMHSSSRLSDCELRADRRYIANARVCIKLAVLSAESFSEMRRRVRAITSKKELREVLDRYPIRLLPFMQRVFTYCMKGNNSVLLILLTRMRYAKE